MSHVITIADLVQPLLGSLAMVTLLAVQRPAHSRLFRTLPDTTRCDPTLLATV